ncbi:MAG: hypothetical protein QOI44_2128 [Actinomycetota bacterium]|nr:hypothetical protein [Actinomycetota bacterium]
MSIVFLLGFSRSAWIGVLTITPALLVTGLLLWLYAMQRGQGGDRGR